MGETFKNVIKTSLIFFAVGAALSFAAPYIALWTGAEASGAIAAAKLGLGFSANPVYLGTFFAAFGALDAVFRPACDWLFKGKGESAETAPQVAHINEPAREQHINIVIQPQRELAAEYVDNRRADFAQRLKEKRELQIEAVPTDVTLH